MQNLQAWMQKMIKLDHSFSSTLLLRTRCSSLLNINSAVLKMRLSSCIVFHSLLKLTHSRNRMAKSLEWIPVFGYMTKELYS